MKLLALSERRKHLWALQLDLPQDQIPVGDAVRRDARFDAQGWLLLDAETCGDAGLHAGQTLEEAELEKLVAQSDYNRAKNRALWYLSGRSYGCRELEQKLAPLFGRQAAAQAVQRLTEVGLLDDAAYAAQLARHYLEEKKLAPARAEREICLRGVDRELARSAVEALAVDPDAQLVSLLETRYRAALDTEKGIARTVAALARKGYRYEEIRAALRQVGRDPSEREIPE